jgi:hypothetical protein
MLHREHHPFPTRQYPYREVVTAVAADMAEVQTLQAGTLYRFVLGLDVEPEPMAADQTTQALQDPFAELLLKRGIFPVTLRALLAELDRHNTAPDGLPDQKVFLVADGGQIPWTPATAGVNRFLRFAVARLRGANFGILVSSSTGIDSDQLFLQVIGWDPHNEVYHYYERRAGTWIWAGNSYHALTEPTRGKGPFDSHVNGSLVMKELRFPWNHWHSDSARIQETVLAPADPLRDELLFQRRLNAEELEKFVVRPGIRRWNEARFKLALRSNGSLTDVPLFLRQVLETTTINLTSSGQESQLVRDDDLLTLPITFFLNTEALLDYIGLNPQISPVQVEGRLYRESLRRFDVALMDGSGFRLPGDTFFAFLVPEPAFEDLDVLNLLLQRHVLSPRLAACLLMVDFPNPVFSARRRQLMAYVPATATLGPTGSDLEPRFVAAVEAVAGELPPESPEQEFLTFIRSPGTAWQRVFEQRIEGYFAALVARARTQDGFDDFVRLAESRRREFRRRPLAEFRLTLPVTNISLDAPALRMCEDGSAVEA